MNTIKWVWLGFVSPAVYQIALTLNLAMLLAQNPGLILFLLTITFNVYAILTWVEDTWYDDDDLGYA